MKDRVKAIQLLYRMVINVLAGQKERNETLYHACLETLDGSDILYPVYNSLITVGEYIEAMQPEVFAALHAVATTTNGLRDVTETVLQAADIHGEATQYAKLMQERPLPGRAGLLPGEREDALL